MTDLCREIFDKYQVRKTKKQKKAFMELLQSRIPELWVQQKGLPKSRNLVIGDPETAKVVLGAHYDTCSQLPFPNFITPKKPLLTICFSFLMILPYVVLALGLSFLAGELVSDPLLTYWISVSVYFLFVFLLLGGPANKHTANDNTSGVITLLEIYERLTPEQRSRVCFVFFDNEEQGLIGSSQFRKVYKKAMKDKLLINFDCVSDGDYFLFGISKTANQKHHVALARSFVSTPEKTVMLENLKKLYYPSDQAGFPVAIAVAALNHKKFLGHYMGRIHTKRDTVFDERNIAYLAEHTVQLIESI